VSRGSHPGPFGSKIFISERTGCYGPLPVLARHGRNGGVRRLTRSATWRARSARSWSASAAAIARSAPAARLRACPEWMPASAN